MNKIINTKPIAILMATYNGEKYLDAQIESILSQTNNEWTLYIQDDGSKDKTLDIIKKYSDNNRIMWVDSGLTRQGCCMNFMTLLNMVESRYYMFCDQDDVWLPEKVQISIDKVRELEKTNPDKPILIHTDKKRVDADLNIILESELNRTNLPIEKLNKLMKERNSLEQLRLGTFIAGCVMCFNHRAKEVSFPFNNSRMQDSVIAMAVAANEGIIATVYRPTMLYRIHTHNTCGEVETSMLNKLRNITNTLNGNLRMYYLYKVYGGGNLLNFIYLRFRRFAIRGF